MKVKWHLMGLKTHLVELLCMIIQINTVSTEVGSRLLGFCTAAGGWPNTLHAML